MKGKEAGLFDNKALASLILSLLVEQFLAVLVGMAESIIWPVAFNLPCTLRAAGDAKVTMYISIASMWFCRIVMSYVLGKYLGMGVFGVWVAMIFDWCVRFVAMTFRYRQGKWKQIDSLA